jgi:hypothetical protein
MIKVIAGALTAGFLDWFLEHLWEIGLVTYPQIEELPPIDDWIPLIAGASVLALGEGLENKDIKEFGIGMVAYSAGMILHHILLRNVSWKIKKH